ncbi:MAG: hypothetical protein WD963_02255 [Candidatus Paceibacterota bacterium]
MTQDSLDLIVRVDRPIKPSYPNWFRGLDQPKLECCGPSEYSLQDGLEEWSHHLDPKHGLVRNEFVYEFLKEHDNLALFLGLQDGLAIEAKDIAVFRKISGGRVIPLWRSVARNQRGDRRVPCLCELGNRVIKEWYWLRDHSLSESLILKFRST